MNWKNLPSWLKVSTFWKKDLVNGGEMEFVSPAEANLVSSFVGEAPDKKRYHVPVLDIDMPVWVTESTTPGHYHLSIDKLLTEEEYDKLLNVLVEVGIVQQGIIDLQWNQDKMTCIRLPGIKKEKNSPSSGSIVSNNNKSWDITIVGSEKDKQLAAEKKKEFTEKKQDLLSKIHPNGGTVKIVANKPKLEFKPGVVFHSDTDTPMKYFDGTASISNYTVGVDNKSVKVPTLIEQETLDKWATDFLPALTTLEKLAEISAHTGQSLTEMIDAWYSMIQKSAQVALPETADKPEW